MTPIDLLELFLYIFPVLELWLVQRYFRTLLAYEGPRLHFRFAVVDIAVPFLIVSTHILSVRLLTFSLLPYYLFLSFLIGLVLTVYADRGPKPLASGKLASLVLRYMFLAGFLLHYGLVAARVWQLLRA